MSDHTQLQPNQHILWSVLCWNFPADICKALEDTPNIHSHALHQLYNILKLSKLKLPSYLLSRIQQLPDLTAGEMLDSLAELNIKPPSHHVPSPGWEYENTRIGRQGSIVKPFFYSSEREKFWYLVLELFKAGYIGSKTDGSACERVADFHALHALYCLDSEHQRTRKEEGKELGNPNHQLYHTTQDLVVEKWLGILSPLVYTRAQVL